MSIGFNVRKAREAAGLDQEELAERVGISRTMVSHIERNRKTPSVMVLADIAKALHCTMDELTADRESGART
ncbi:MAG: helix-turn-helix transcriptional regulator [Ruminococcus sp.]|nr:helix-turn-helix transcriptional regulator [Ruminococcus sp.]MCM1380298.1 helix-turn-helix transcriptional regulator [Muribaculaceae bacterium]MCM1478278.1 helix-turn-helix transcriptional regulator [Muribaculaceae bacterium]